MWDPYASLVRLVGVEPPDPRVKKVVRDLCPGGDERLELPHKDFSCCGMRQVGHGEEPARVDVLEVFPEGCHYLARGCGGVDFVEPLQFRGVEGTRAPLLQWPGGWGGHCLLVLVRCGASRGGVPPGGARVCPRHVPRGGLLLLGHRAGCGGGQWVIGLLRAGGLCHFCVRSWAARVVPLLLRSALCAVAVWLCCIWGGEPRGARARLSGGRCPCPGLVSSRLAQGGGGVGGVVPQPLAQAFGWPRVSSAVCPWRAFPPAAGRPPTLGGRWRMSWTLRLLPGEGPV